MQISFILIAISAIIPTVSPKISPFSKISSVTVSNSAFPSQYQYAADWIWNNRIMKEDSCGVKSKRYNLIFDQIIANKGQLNYVGNPQKPSPMNNVNPLNRLLKKVSINGQIFLLDTKDGHMITLKLI